MHIKNVSISQNVLLNAAGLKARIYGLFRGKEKIQYGRGTELEGNEGLVKDH